MLVVNHASRTTVCNSLCQNQKTHLQLNVELDEFMPVLHFQMRKVKIDWSKQLLSVISAVTKPDTVVMTDDFKGYNIMNHKATNPENFTHISVCHSLGEFSSGKGLHTNGIEGFWAILKRSIIGSYHHISTKYLQSYVNECCFRQNNRFVDAFNNLLKQSVLVT